MLLPIVYEIASGRPFFVTAAVLALAALASAWLPWRGARRAAVITAAAAAMLMAVIPLPLPWIALALLWTVTVGWFATFLIAREQRRPLERGNACSLAFTIAGVGVLELVASLGSPPAPAAFDRVMIVGDSVAAGIGGVGEQTWPRLLAARHPIQVIDASMAGARLRDALAK
jgi:hypothetical protein